MSHITATDIDLNQVLYNAHDQRAGAVVLFSGEVRDHHHGKEVTHLEYEAYGPMADKAIAEIIEDAKTKWRLFHVFCQHRVGRVDLKQSAVVVATSAAHRREAYEANQYIINRVKAEAPIWKREHFVDGTQVWVEQCSENAHAIPH